MEYFFRFNFLYGSVIYLPENSLSKIINFQFMNIVEAITKSQVYNVCLLRLPANNLSLFLRGGQWPREVINHIYQHIFKL